MRMSKSIVASILGELTIAGCLALVSATATADDDHHGGDKPSASAVFGRGLNTAQPPSNPLNHVIVPRQIRVDVGGVVDFVVAGFHDIVIFKPGFTLDDLITAGGGDLPRYQTSFVLPPDPAEPLPSGVAFLTDEIYYRGLNPAGGPLGTAVTPNPTNVNNRAEPVAFLEKGRYLVICNVRSHLINGMLAYVTVK
jgi:hypothetical protein